MKLVTIGTVVLAASAPTQVAQGALRDNKIYEVNLDTTPSVIDEQSDAAAIVAATASVITAAVSIYKAWKNR